MSSSNKEYHVKITTNQLQYFKNMILSIKDIPEANFRITPEGFSINEQSLTRSSSVMVNLPAKNFTEFYCAEPIKIGVDIANMTKILKSLGSSKDFLTIFVEKIRKEHIHIPFGILLTNPDKNEVTTIYIATIDVNEDDEQIPIESPYKIQMPSIDFQEIVAKLKVMGGEVCRILFHGSSNTINFNTSGDLGKLEIVRSKMALDNGLNIVRSQHTSNYEIISVFCKLQKLVEYTKCTTLSHIVTIGIGNENDKIMVEYDVGALGNIILLVGCEKIPDEW